jgi:HD-GYP domain-containing protein (c-di-GMP phosphodiesterase class II)
LAYGKTAGARIVAIADTLNAITSDRPYRPAQDLQAARAEIKSWSGKQFDPEIVEFFLSIPYEVWIELRREIDSQVHGLAPARKK